MTDEPLVVRRVRSRDPLDEHDYIKDDGTGFGSIQRSRSTQSVSTASTTNILQLPDELIEKIFSFLLLRDLANAIMVCKDWYEVGSHRSLWDKCHLRRISFFTIPSYSLWDIFRIGFLWRLAASDDTISAYNKKNCKCRTRKCQQALEPPIAHYSCLKVSTHFRWSFVACFALQYVFLATNTMISLVIYSENFNVEPMVVLAILSSVIFIVGTVIGVSNLRFSIRNRGITDVMQTAIYAALLATLQRPYSALELLLSVISLWLIRLSTIGIILKRGHIFPGERFNYEDAESVIELHFVVFLLSLAYHIPNEAILAAIFIGIPAYFRRYGPRELALVVVGSTMVVLIYHSAVLVAEGFLSDWHLFYHHEWTVASFMMRIIMMGLFFSVLLGFMKDPAVSSLEESIATHPKVMAWIPSVMYAVNVLIVILCFINSASCNHAVTSLGVVWVFTFMSLSNLSEHERADDASSDSDVQVVDEIGLEFVMFYGPPCVGKTTYLSRNNGPFGRFENYEIVPPQAYSSVHKTIQFIVKALKRDKSVVMDSRNEIQRTRVAILQAIKQAGVKVKVTGLSFVPQDGSAQLQYAMEFAWAETCVRTNPTNLTLSDEEEQQVQDDTQAQEGRYVVPTSDDLNDFELHAQPMAYTEGFDDLQYVTLPLFALCDPFARPALFIELGAILDLGAQIGDDGSVDIKIQYNYEPQVLAASIEAWLKLNPSGLAMVVVDELRSFPCLLESVPAEQLSYGVLECRQLMMKALLDLKCSEPVYYVMSEYGAFNNNHFFRLPNPGILAWAQMKHGIDLTKSLYISVDNKAPLNLDTILPKHFFEGSGWDMASKLRQNVVKQSSKIPPFARKPDFLPHLRQHPLPSESLENDTDGWKMNLPSSASIGRIHGVCVPPPHVERHEEPAPTPVIEKTTPERQLPSWMKRTSETKRRKLNEDEEEL